MQAQAKNLSREELLSKAYEMEYHMLESLLTNRVAKISAVRSTAFELAKSLYSQANIKTIKELQVFLNNTINAGLKVDGIFGKETLKALILKLQVDSLNSNRGSKYAGALSSLRKMIYPRLNTHKSVRILAKHNEHFIKILNMGSVVNLQKRLRRQGFTDYANKRITIDGYLGKRTLSSYLKSLEESASRSKPKVAKQNITRAKIVPKKVAISARVLEGTKANGKKVYYAYLDKVQSSSYVSAINPGIVLSVGTYDETTDGFMAYRSRPNERLFRRHTGVDVHTGDKSVSIKAPTDCEVVYASSKEHPTMGYYLKLKTKVDGRTVYMTFMHLKEPAGFSKGDIIGRGDTIGMTGKTGNAKWEDNQVHFEMYTYASHPNYDGRVRYYIDPTPIMLAGNITRTRKA